MTKILFAGDTHGNYAHTERVFDHALRNDADLIVQVGDFGFGWQQIADGSDYFSSLVSGLAQTHRIPLYWLGGNHENYDALDALVGTAPPDVSEIAPQVYYLARGATLTFDGVRFLFCGGATSVDKKYRVDGVSWWRQEEISYADVDRCKAQGTVDFLITHDFPWEVDGVVDRHLDPYWGEEAQEKTIASRKKISTILSNCNAFFQIHGHLHINYNQTITVNEHPVLVRGLGCDGMPMEMSTYLIDTNDYRLTPEASDATVEGTDNTENTNAIH